MLKINNLGESSNTIIKSSMMNAYVIEYIKSNSTFSELKRNDLNFKQLIVNLSNQSVMTRIGAFQWSAGDIEMNANIKGVGDLISKKISTKMTKLSTIRPILKGTGTLAFEPTLKNIILENINEWGGVAIFEHTFIGCDGNVQIENSKKNTTLSKGSSELSHVLYLEGEGWVAFESNFAKEDLVEIILDNNEIRVDGNLVVAWSSTLNSGVEQLSTSLANSSIDGEKMLNFFRGTGRVLMMPYFVK